MKLIRPIAVILLSLAAVSGHAASSDATASSSSTSRTSHISTTHHARAARVHESATASRHIQQLQHSRRVSYTRRRRHHYYEQFTGNSFTTDNTIGDVTEGEDPVVRQAAITALGDMNGTAVAIDPSNGRILAMVNQKLALSPGAEPCSTIKLMVGLAALSEGIVTRDTQVNLGGFHMTLTDALAKSNNLYFETLGRALGFERVKHYANTFGLGELAGYNIPGEKLGEYPDQPLPESAGGVGRMCSFGEGVSMTPLQLGALVSAMANGGTLFYLQHPTSTEDLAAFKPMVKRQLNISAAIPQMVDGMEGAVNYGTARSLHANFNEFPVLGKTGTCSNEGTRYGWFASIANTPSGRIVTVFFLEGGRPTFGPKAAELTGQFYRALYDSQYFGPSAPQPTISSLQAPVMSGVPQQSSATITTSPVYSTPDRIGSAEMMESLPQNYTPPTVLQTSESSQYATSR
jgi:membrane carboxypeptidase/penicillin-binding protein